MKIPDGKIIYEKYLLTPDGEVFSLLFVNKNACLKRLKKIKPNTKWNYPRVCLCNSNIKTSKAVHVLMLETFDRGTSGNI